MKNLEALGVREMDASEMSNENGGFLGLLFPLAATALAAATVATVTAVVIAGVVASFEEGRENAKN